MILGLAAVYYGAAKLGLSLAFETASVTAVWPPTGIALAALVLFGFRLWPGVALGAFLANAWTGVPFLTVLGITAGNTLEALAGAYLLVSVAGFRPSLERAVDVLRLVLLGAVISTAVSATIGTSSLLAGGEIDGEEFGSVWRTWWFGDMGGALVVAPALMVAVTHWPFRIAAGRIAEVVGLTALVAGTVLLVFTRELPITFALVPLPLVAAFRFGQPGAVLASLISAAIAIPLTQDGQGPFAGYSPDDRLVMAQLFVGVVSITTLVVAAVVTERRRAEESVRKVAETLQESLLPAGLPAIAGIQAAVDFRPAGDREIVGGDFYELVEGNDGSIGVAIGDAVGKGAIAAADTALARYTLRAAALQESRPSRILGVLNEAILGHASDHPCTVAYARLERHDGGASLTVSLGGHPKPLILRGEGTVEPIGMPAAPLGVRRGLDLTDHKAELAPGDALIFYTDGLTDAYAPARPITADDIAAALPPHAGGSATEIIDAVRQAALPPQNGKSPRDDILVLVLRLES
jgi:integral membrane sensor domain MASE1